MDDRPIGVFDSGIGGLTVFSEIIRLLPDESIIYFGDTARFPYGPKNLEDVRHFVFKIAEFLIDRNVKMIVIACNTATAAAIDDLRQRHSIPVIGVIEPGARIAAQYTTNKRVGLIATKGTVLSRAYEIAVKKINPEIKLFSHAAPKLVELIEAGILDGKELDDVINVYLLPLIMESIDVLILGCTHLPLIEKKITALSKNRFKVVSSAVETAEDVKSTLLELGLASSKIENKAGNVKEFYETGSKSHFLEVGRIFLGEKIREVKRVTLDI